MKIVKSNKIQEQVYMETLENGLKVMCIPKKDTKNKYVIWGTHFGSIDNHFVDPKTNKEIEVPDGVAHYLEHKLFEQPDGTNSLDTLMALGIDANAYTTNDHTAFLFSCNNHFYEGLDELMDYVQHPYFTDENVEKERGIIGQEIQMYDDDPSWSLYMNAMKAMYKDNPIRIDIAGTIESISKITKDTLYTCYNTFYNPSNMTLVVCGDFEPEKMLDEIKIRLIETKSEGNIKRIYKQEQDEICTSYVEKNMQVSQPIFAIGFKDKPVKDEKIQRHIAIEIILNLLLGKSSKTYRELYNSGLLMSEPDLDYEFTDEYAYVLISGQSEDPKKIDEKLVKAIKEYKENGIPEEDFLRIRKKLYGDYVVEYNSVENIGRMFLADSFKGINSLDYIEEFDSVSLEYTNNILKEVFKEDKKVLSVVKEK